MCVCVCVYIGNTWHSFSQAIHQIIVLHINLSINTGHLFSEWCLRISKYLRTKVSNTIPNDSIKWSYYRITLIYKDCECLCVVTDNNSLKYYFLKAKNINKFHGPLKYTLNILKDSFIKSFCASALYSFL